MKKVILLFLVTALLLISIGFFNLNLEINASEMSHDNQANLSTEVFPSIFQSSGCTNMTEFCSLELNNHYQLEITTPTYSKDAQEGIGQIFSMHYAIYPDYEIPLTKIWKMMGIENYLQEPDVPECQSKVIKFDHQIPHNEYCYLSDTRFIWKGKPQRVKSKPLSPVTFEINFPAQVSGMMRVTGGFVTFNFDSNARPRLKASSMGSITFDDEINCLTIGIDYAVARGVTSPGVDQYHPVIIFK